MAPCSAWGWRVCEVEQAEIAASNSPSQASHMHVWPRSDRSLAYLRGSRALEQLHWGTALFHLFKGRRRKGSLGIISCLYIQSVVFSQSEAFSTWVGMSTLAVQSRFCHTHHWCVSWLLYQIKQTIADARNIPTYRYLNTLVSASMETTVYTGWGQNQSCLKLVPGNGSLVWKFLIYTFTGFGSF